MNSMNCNTARESNLDRQEHLRSGPGPCTPPGAYLFCGTVRTRLDGDMVICTQLGVRYNEMGDDSLAASC